MTRETHEPTNQRSPDHWRRAARRRPPAPSPPVKPVDYLDMDAIQAEVDAGEDVLDAALQAISDRNELSYYLRTKPVVGEHTARLYDKQHEYQLFNNGRVK